MMAAGSAQVRVTTAKLGTFKHSNQNDCLACEPLPRAAVRVSVGRWDTESPANPCDPQSAKAIAPSKKWIEKCQIYPRQRPAHAAQANSAQRSTMLGAYSSLTLARTATTARWPNTGRTCSPIRRIGLVSQLKTNDPQARREASLLLDVERTLVVRCGNACG
jgi:hypothetical protein